LDSRLFKNLDLSIDVFYETRNGILSSRSATIPAIIGSTLPYENIGRTSNHGVELSLNYNNNIDKFKYFAGVNLSFAKNKIEYQDEVVRAESYLYRTGQRIGQLFGLEAIGLFNSEEEINDNENLQECGVCDEIVNRDMHYYCPVCKTKIDWQE